MKTCTYCDRKNDDNAERCNLCGHPFNADPALKGKHGGNCNRTACQRPGALWFNHSTRAHYCMECAVKLNRENPDTLTRYGYVLCTLDPLSERNVGSRDELLRLTREAMDRDEHLVSCDLLTARGVQDDTGRIGNVNLTTGEWLYFIPEPA